MKKIIIANADAYFKRELLIRSYSFKGSSSKEMVNHSDVAIFPPVYLNY